MSKRSKKVEPKSSNLFTCPDHRGALDVAEWKKHLEVVHGILPADIKGTKVMTLHLDGRETFTSQYEWTLLNGFKFTQTITSERDADDMMRYA